ncbi:MAG: hypothetical protein HPY50_01610 [Firmicutes bacterium]|nr:hypothetical protein [Bacillota bacterium]
MESFMPLIELTIIIVSILVFAKLAGVFKKLTLSAGFKKWATILSLLVLIALNLGVSMYKTEHMTAQNWQMQNIFVGVGLFAVIIFALALMSSSKDGA